MPHNHFKLQANFPNACKCYTALFWPSIRFLTDLLNQKNAQVNTSRTHTFRYMTERKYSNIMQSDILFNSVEFISILAIYLYL
jgi:hypothetical protein